MQIVDQTGYQLEIKQPVSRIVSLVPSQTELLYDLGLEDRIAGVTRFCVHPKDKFRTKPFVGGTKNVQMQDLELLKPDLVIANKEENERSQIEDLRKRYPVYTSDISTLEHAYEMINTIGQLTQTETVAEQWVAKIRDAFHSIVPNERKVAYLIWQNPYMAAGGDTFINTLIEAAGMQNVFANRERYPGIDLEDLIAAKPDLVLLSSEPFPFKLEHQRMIQKDLENSTVMLVDGEMFSWYGSRLAQFPAYVNEFLLQ